MLTRLGAYRPLVEFYSDLAPSFGKRAAMDVYWLGRATFTQGDVDFAPLDRASTQGGKGVSRELPPRTFVQMAIIDGRGIDEDRYQWRYVGREFVGRLRCLVFDLIPRSSGDGTFQGRVWASEDDDSIVRFNGIHDGNGKHYRAFHFDSWRVCKTQGFCLPSAIYVDERELSSPIAGMNDLRARVTFWGYGAAAQLSKGEKVTVDVVSDVKIHDSDVPTVDQEGAWQEHAESNVITYFEATGMLAPAGDVNGVLEQVVTNLRVSGNLDSSYPVHCRVLLTTRLELFTVHRTIVISQGLVNTLKDEAGLAAVLAPAVAHIALGHAIKQAFGFNEWRLRDESDIYQNVLDFRRSDTEIREADKMAFDLLFRSPYRKEAGKIGEFLATVSQSCVTTVRLLTPQMGDPIPGCSDLYTRMDSLKGLIRRKPDAQGVIVSSASALPLWSRIELDPWSDQLRWISPTIDRKYSPFEIVPVALEPDRREAGFKIEDVDKVLTSGKLARGRASIGTK